MLFLVNALPLNLLQFLTFDISYPHALCLHTTARPSSPSMGLSSGLRSTLKRPMCHRTTTPHPRRRDGLVLVGCFEFGRTWFSPFCFQANASPAYLPAARSLPRYWHRCHPRSRSPS